MSKASSPFCGSGIVSGGSSTHNKYSAHLPHSTFKLPDSEGRACHRPSKSLTFFSVSVAGSASTDIHVKPKVRRHLQHRSRVSKLFPSNAWALSPRRSWATYPFRASRSTSTFVFRFDVLTTWSTSFIMISQACLPLLPNRNALVFITHCWRKLPGTQASFDVATQTLSLSGSFLPIQKVIVLGDPSWLAVGPKLPYSIFSLAMISSGN